MSDSTEQAAAVVDEAVVRAMPGLTSDARNRTEQAFRYLVQQARKGDQRDAEQSDQDGQAQEPESAGSNA